MGKRNMSPVRQGFIAFCITMIISSILLAAQFLYIYELPKKNLSLLSNVPLTVYFILSIAPTILILSVFSFNVFSSWKYFRMISPPEITVSRIMLISACTVLLCSGYNSFIAPWVNTPLILSLYTIRQANNQEELADLEKKNNNDTATVHFFSKQPLSSNIFQLFKARNKQIAKKKKEKENLVSSLSSYTDYHTIKSILDSSSARHYGISIKDFSPTFNSTGKKYSRTIIHSLLAIYAYDCKIANYKIAEYARYIYSQLFYPLILFLIIINGIAVGYILRDVNLPGTITIVYFLFILIPVFFHYYINLLTREQKLQPVTEQIIYVALLFILPIIFLRSLKKYNENRSEDLINN